MARKGDGKAEPRPALPDGFVAYGDAIFVLPERPAVSGGGVIIPDAGRRRELRGEVIACGPGRTDGKGHFWPMPVKPGDTVFYGEYAGQDVPVGDRTWKVIRQVELLAKVEGA